MSKDRNYGFDEMGSFNPEDDEIVELLGDSDDTMEYIVVREERVVQRIVVPSDVQYPAKEAFRRKTEEGYLYLMVGGQ